MNNAQEANINKSTPEITSVGIFEKLTQGNKMSKKSIALILSLLLTSSVLMGGCGGTSVSAENQPGTNVEQDESNVKVPKEASDFVEEFGSKYESTQETVGAYFATEKYIEENELHLVFDQSFKDQYDELLMGRWGIDGADEYFDQETQTDFLGFKKYQMSPENSIESDETSIIAMDNLVGPMTELMLNYLIKNPDTESYEIIKWEYLKICSIAGYDPLGYENGENELYNQFSDSFCEKMQTIADTFKGNQNLKYVPSANENGSTAKCSGYSHTGEDILGFENVRSQAFDANMHFIVETFDSQGRITTDAFEIEIPIHTLTDNISNNLYFAE